MTTKTHLIACSSIFIARCTFFTRSSDPKERIQAVELQRNKTLFGFFFLSSFVYTATRIFSLMSAPRSFTGFPRSRESCEMLLGCVIS